MVNTPLIRPYFLGVRSGVCVYAAFWPSGFVQKAATYVQSRGAECQLYLAIIRYVLRPRGVTISQHLLNRDDIRFWDRDSQRLKMKIWRGLMACDLFQGPLVALRGFHPSTIKWCSMHVINLGLCYGVNGGGLYLPKTTRRGETNGGQSSCATRKETQFSPLSRLMRIGCTLWSACIRSLRRPWQLGACPSRTHETRDTPRIDVLPHIDAYHRDMRVDIFKPSRR